QRFMIDAATYNKGAAEVGFNTGLKLPMIGGGGPSMLQAQPQPSPMPQQGAPQARPALPAQLGAVSGMQQPPMAPAQAGGPVLPQSAVPLSPKAQQELAAKQVGGANDEFQKYENSLGSTVSTGRQVLERADQVQELLKKYKTGGFLAPERLQLGVWLNHAGMPNAAKTIAGGDPAAGQVLEKEFVGGSLAQLRQALTTDDGTQAGKTNKAEFEAFSKANPNLETDPEAIAKLRDFSKRLYDRGFQEQQALLDARTNPKSKYGPV